MKLAQKCRAFLSVIRFLLKLSSLLNKRSVCVRISFVRFSKKLSSQPLRLSQATASHRHRWDERFPASVAGGGQPVYTLVPIPIVVANCHASSLRASAERPTTPPPCGWIGQVTNGHSSLRTLIDFRRLPGAQQYR
ncbi:uncharacterized protein LOC134219062 [Armigeres subalbatus]|uniref:uncharacterized protein LOC134219062 n=1 Tax=Armigeres subalbatus TaxID=124917 RepID=UPI002ED3F552